VAVQAQVLKACYAVGHGVQGRELGVQNEAVVVVESELHQQAVVKSAVPKLLGILQAKEEQIDGKIHSGR
jgi:hypothetical protein